MNDFYVYIHQRNDTGKCFYVGKGKSNRYKSTQRRNEHWKNIVNKVGYTPLILINGLTEDKAFELEKEVIKQVGIDNLCNMSEGGEGVSGYRHTDEAKIKMSEGKKGRKLTEEQKIYLSKLFKGRISPSKGRKLTEEQKNQVSLNLKGRKVSDETRKKISESNKGKKHSDESREKIRLFQKIKFKPVKIDNITYISIGECARQLNLSKAALKYRLKSKNFTNYKYV
jgi:hypothetical protein